jgi:hypothetical protein
MVELSLIKNSGQIIADNEALSLLRENFSIANPAFRKNVPYVSSRLYSITPSGKFEVGLLGEIIKYLEHSNYQYGVSTDLKKEFSCGFETPIIKKLSIDYRDYQEQSITAAIKQGRGVTIIPTAGGKTLICAGLIESFR